ncbi:MAG: hypothetical protein ACREL4_06955, partial [Gemmatimonadales bacterium]
RASRTSPTPPPEMPRWLSVSRAAVAAGREAEYLATVRDLALTLGQQGQHLWLFRSTTDERTFLEFSEGPSAATHRTQATLSFQEQQLESRLRTLAVYAPDAWALWEEVPVTTVLAGPTAPEERSDAP